MAHSTPLEQTYLKIPCRSCGQVTPHVDNTTTQCQVCFTANFHLSVKTEYYSGWELAAFWQQKYRSVLGYGVPVQPVVVTAVAGPSNQFPVTVGGVTHWLDPEPQRVQYAGVPVTTGTVMLAEAIEGGVLVSSENIPSIDPNSIGTL